MQLKEIKWVPNVRRRFSWFVEYFQIAGTTQFLFEKVLGLPIAFNYMKKDCDYNEYTNLQEDKRSQNKIKQLIKNNSCALNVIAKKSYKKSKILLRAAEKAKNAKEKDLTATFDQLAKELLEYQPIIFSIFSIERQLEETLLREIKYNATKAGKENMMGEYLALFTAPKEELVMIKEEKNLLYIATKKKQGQSIKKLIQKHIESYAWIPTDDPLGKAWTENDLLTRLNEMIEDHPNKKLAKINALSNERKQAYTKAIKELNLTKKTIELIAITRDFVYLRNYRVECWVKAQYEARPLFEKIAKKFNLTFEELMSMNYKEIFNALHNNLPPSTKLIQERSQGYSYLKIKGKTIEYFGEDAKKIPAPKNEAKNKKLLLNEFFGNMANKGKVTGIVKIVNELSDLKKVKKGDILVASMTVPQFIPAMEKAAAFVTDEGGITCHAAIVARELDVPCIVATKIATQTLKDGDLVEIDATNAKVRILKRFNF